MPRQIAWPAHLIFMPGKIWPLEIELIPSAIAVHPDLIFRPLEKDRSEKSVSFLIVVSFEFNWIFSLKERGNMHLLLPGIRPGPGWEWLHEWHRL